MSQSLLRLITHITHATRTHRLQDENGQFRDPAWDASATDVANQNHRMTLPPRIAPIGDLEALQKTLSEEYPSLAKEFKSSALLQPFPNAFTDDNNNTLLRAHTLMLRLREMDDMLLQAQRQGRISFYMTCRGEEAIHMGAAAALDSQDPILAQYREQGLLMWRGFTLDQFTNQCFSNAADLGKGRQMPVHYGSRALQYHTVSSPLGTQIPQSVGVAYKLKLDKKQNIAVCFFGDGAASTPDFHSAMNMAATLRAPVVFICRNNGYAISTPVTDQYAGDGIVSRAPGYGMAALRVDGNDVFAMAAAVRHARAYALQHTAPVLLEAMTHRQGHHSTSDDSTRYRTSSDYADDPVERLSRFLQRQGWMTPDEEANARAREKVSVLKAIEQAERRPPPSLDTLFQDVYHDVPKHLQEQEAQLRDHIAKHPNAYNKKQS
jgi:2-oxoisovalerate dehydrogenase E1 component alpha subunit